ncbi:hypothetical protein MRX96_019059 [Rhipicephalus microplus]
MMRGGVVTSHVTTCQGHRGFYGGPRAEHHRQSRPVELLLKRRPPPASRNRVAFGPSRGLGHDSEQVRVLGEMTRQRQCFTNDDVPGLF